MVEWQRYDFYFQISVHARLVGSSQACSHVLSIVFPCGFELAVAFPCLSRPKRKPKSQEGQKINKQTKKMPQAGGFQDGCRDIKSTHNLMRHFVDSSLRFDVHRLSHTVCKSGENTGDLMYACTGAGVITLRARKGEKK